VSAERRLKEHRSGFSATSLKIPDGTNILSVKKEGNISMDVIPYTVGKGNPYADEGELYYERTYWCHRGVGPNKDSYICMAKTFGKKCFICDYRSKLAADPESDEKLVRSLAPSERQLWNVRLTKEPEKIYLFDYSWWLFGKHLDNKINNAEDKDKDRYKLFADPEVGRTLKIGITKDEGGGMTSYTMSDIELRKREEALPKDILESALCLDDLLREVTYSDLKQAFLQAEDADERDGDGEEEEDEDEETSEEEDEDEDEEKDEDDDVEEEDEETGEGGNEEGEEEEEDDDNRDEPEESKASDFDIEEGSLVKHPKFGTCEVFKVSRDGTSLTLEDKKGKMHTAVAPDEVKLVKADEPKKPTSKKPSTSTKDTPFDEEDEDESGEEDVEDSDGEEEEVEEEEGDDDGEGEEDEGDEEEVKPKPKPKSNKNVRRGKK
jgi:hypothetical protein